MKKILTILICFLALNLYSQNYTFSVSSGTYSDLQGATDLTNGQPWSWIYYVIPIGFDFEFYGQTFDTAHIRSYVHLDDADMYFINQFFIMFTDRGNSPISYLLEGNVGSRILKIEWKNMGFEGEQSSLGSTEDYVSVQLWLYEGSNNLEFRIGPSSVQHPNESYYGWGGPWIGIDHVISYPPGANVEAISLDGNPVNPNIVYNDTTFGVYLDGTPADGTIYKFEYSTTGSNETELDEKLYIYPNPSSDLINIDLPNEAEMLSIYNTSGEIIKSLSLNSNMDVLQLDITNFAKGLYIVEVLTPEGNFHSKVLKQ